MDIRINKLTLQNFKGIRNLVIDADGKDLNIYGDNATGKTTVFDAFTWLLFGKDSLGRADFGIKTQDGDGNALHNLEHSAECEMTIDGAILTLKKVYAEKWTKKRGSAEAEFTGHETRYFINEVPSTKKEYEQRIAGFIDEQLFRIYTNPLYFNEHLKWQERRAILLNLCGGDISDNDIIARMPEFSPLIDELKGRTVQEYKKVVQSKQAAINDELKAIPQRISEASLAIPATVAEVDETEKTECEKRIADFNAQINNLKTGAGVTTIAAEVNALKERKKQIEAAKCDVSDYEAERGRLAREIEHEKLSVANLESNIKSTESLIASLEKKAEGLREMWHDVNDKQYTADGNCPTCGQTLPPEQIEAAKIKFNTTRAADLEEITASGKAATAEAQEYRLKLDGYIKTKNSAEILIGEKQTALDGIIALIDAEQKKFEENRAAELSYINSRIAEAEKSGQNATESVKTTIDAITAQIAAETARIAEINKAIAGRDVAERQQKRIAELAADEKRLAGEYAELDRMVYLIDTFIMRKIEMLSDNINSLFTNARFKLFDVQINGGVAECCEVTYNGVEYSDLNNASRINVGLDIINTLCRANGKTAPIIIDNAESVTEIEPTAAQKICLFVSAGDKALRIEHK